MHAYIQLKSDNFVEITDFKYITYPDGHGNFITIDKFDNFYLFNHQLTFVGENSIATLSSKDIEFIKFTGDFNK